MTHHAQTKHIGMVVQMGFGFLIAYQIEFFPHKTIWGKALGDFVVKCFLPDSFNDNKSLSTPSIVDR